MAARKTGTTGKAAKSAAKSAGGKKKAAKKATGTARKKAAKTQAKKAAGTGAGTAAKKAAKTSAKPSSQDVSRKAAKKVAKKATKAVAKKAAKKVAKKATKAVAKKAAKIATRAVKKAAREPAAAEPPPAPVVRGVSERPVRRAAKRAGGAVSSLAVNLGHVFGLRPRVDHSFRQADFLSARQRLQDETYASIEEAARAVVEKALELTREGGRGRGPERKRW